jgi:hypothetical protein
MKYEQPPPMSRQELEEAFRSGNGRRVRDALISASYTEEGSLVADWCLSFVHHSDALTRSAAALVIGHIAISSCQTIDLPKCLDAVRSLAADSVEAVRNDANDALDDIVHAIRPKSAS